MQDKTGGYCGKQHTLDEFNACKECKEISMTNVLLSKKDGGYCPMCDTVWASPGKCRCDEDKFKWIEHGSIHVASWNAAIEAVVELAISDYHVTAEEIRKLKK